MRPESRGPPQRAISPRGIRSRVGRTANSAFTFPAVARTVEWCAGHPGQTIGDSTMRGTKTTTMLVLAGALLLTGCASGGSAGSTPKVDACATVQSAVRDISNGAQNTLAAAGTPSEIQAKLEDYSARVVALAEKAENPDVADALAKVDEKLAEVSAAVGSLPTDEDGAIDAEAIAEQQAGIQEAADKLKTACSATDAPSGY